MARVYSIQELKDIGELSKANWMLSFIKVDGMADSSIANSVSDEEEFRCVDWTDYQDHDIITPRLTFGEESECQDQKLESISPDNLQTAVPVKDSDLESLMSISDSDSVAESWANESSLADVKASESNPTVPVMSEKNLAHSSPEQVATTIESLTSRLQVHSETNQDTKKIPQEMSADYRAILEQNEILFRDNTIFQENAWKIAHEKSLQIPCYCQDSKAHDDDVFIPTRELKDQVRELRKQIMDIKEERKLDKEMHEKLKGHYYRLNQKHQDLMCNGDLSGTQVHQTILEQLKISVLERTNKTLFEEIKSLNAHHDELRRQYSTIYGKYKEFKSSSRPAIEQCELEATQNGDITAPESQVTVLLQQIVDLKATNSKLEATSALQVRNFDIKGQEFEQELADLKQKHRKETEFGNAINARVCASYRGLWDDYQKLKSRNYDLEIKVSGLEKKKTMQAPEDPNAIKSIRAEFQALLKAHTELKRKHTALKMTRDEFKFRDAGLQQKLTNLQTSSEERSKAQIASCEALESKYTSLKRDYDALKSCSEIERLKLQASYQALEKSYQTLETSYQTLETSYQTLETSYQTLQTSYQTIKTSYQTPEDSYTVLQTAYQGLQVSNHALQLSHREIQDEKKAWAFSLSILDNVNEELRTQIQRLTTSRDELQTAYQDLQFSHREVEAEKRECDVSRVALGAAHDELRVQVQTVTASRNELHTAYRALESAHWELQGVQGATEVCRREETEGHRIAQRNLKTLNWVLEVKNEELEGVNAGLRAEVGEERRVCEGLRMRLEGEDTREMSAGGAEASGDGEEDPKGADMSRTQEHGLFTWLGSAFLLWVAGWVLLVFCHYRGD